MQKHRRESPGCTDPCLSRRDGWDTEKKTSRQGLKRGPCCSSPIPSHASSRHSSVGLKGGPAFILISEYPRLRLLSNSRNHKSGFVCLPMQRQHSGMLAWGWRFRVLSKASPCCCPTHRRDFREVMARFCVSSAKIMACVFLKCTKKV